MCQNTQADRATEELYNAVVSNDLPGVYDKIAAGADVNFVFGPAYSCAEGYTPLMVACHRCVFVERDSGGRGKAGARIICVFGPAYSCTEGYTPLMVACHRCVSICWGPPACWVRECLACAKALLLSPQLRTLQQTSRSCQQQAFMSLTAVFCCPAGAAWSVPKGCCPHSPPNSTQSTHVCLLLSCLEGPA
jgi:hypothetical protein